MSSWSLSDLVIPGQPYIGIRQKTITYFVYLMAFFHPANMSGVSPMCLVQLKNKGHNGDSNRRNACPQGVCILVRKSNNKLISTYKIVEARAGSMKDKIKVVEGNREERWRVLL